MKSTTKHKIVYIQLGVWGSAVSSPSGVRGGSPEALALFMLINIPASNLLKLTSRKRDMHERKYVKWGMMTLAQFLYNIMT